MRSSTATRRRRALEREVREVTFEWNSNDPSHLPLLLNWKSDAFEGMRKWLLSPLNRALVQELADSDSEDYSCLTSVLYADGKPISISLNLRRGHILSQWIAGFDPEYSRFSPGTLNMLALYAEAPERGVQIADFGYGNDRYKPAIRKWGVYRDRWRRLGQPSWRGSTLFVSKSQVP